MPGLGSKADFLSPKMAKTRKQKELMVKDFSERLSKMKAAVFVNYRGISVPQIQELRKKLRKKEADFMIAQNRLLKIALKDTDYKCPEEIFKGPLLCGGFTASKEHAAPTILGKKSMLGTNSSPA